MQQDMKFLKGSNVTVFLYQTVRICPIKNVMKNYYPPNISYHILFTWQEKLICGHFWRMTIWIRKSKILLIDIDFWNFYKLQTMIYYISSFSTSCRKKVETYNNIYQVHVRWCVFTVQIDNKMNDITRQFFIQFRKYCLPILYYSCKILIICVE